MIDFYQNPQDQLVTFFFPEQNTQFSFFFFLAWGKGEMLEFFVRLKCYISLSSDHLCW